MLEAVDFEVKLGSFVSFIGPSGCGKTTLLRLISGLASAGAGQLLVRGQPAEDQPVGYGFVFQSPSLFPWLTVGQNISKPLSLAGRSRTEISRRVDEVLELVKLENIKERYPNQLSGGMRQRVAIARALAPDPDMLLMDEPFSAVDEITREKLNAMLHGLWKETGKTILFVTHSIPEAAFLSSEVHVLAGTPARIVESRNVRLPDPRDETTLDHPDYVSLVTELRKALRDVS